MLQVTVGASFTELTTERMSRLVFDTADVLLDPSLLEPKEDYPASNKWEMKYVRDDFWEVGQYEALRNWKPYIRVFSYLEGLELVERLNTTDCGD